MLDSFHAIFRPLEQLAKPTIALVDGAALGGGCELVAACDIVIASDRSRFGQPEIKLGVFPPVAAMLLSVDCRRKARSRTDSDWRDNRCCGGRPAGFVQPRGAGRSSRTEAAEVLAKLRELSGVAQFTRRAMDLGRGRRSMPR